MSSQTRANSLELVRHDTMDRFLDFCAKWLELDPIRNNPILSVTASIKRGQHVFGEEYWLATIHDNASVVGCALVVKPDGLLLSQLPFAANASLIARLIDDEIDFERINGPCETAVRFAEQWCSGRDISWVATHEFIIHELTELQHPSRVASGTLRKASQNDIGLVKEWSVLYGAENPAPVNVTTFFLNKLNEGDLFFWDDPEPRTMIAVAQTNHSARVAAVFTHLRFREQGYASTAVSEITQYLLDQGANKCALLVNRKNTVAMRVYQSLGYVATGDRASILVSKSPRQSAK